MKGKPHLMSLEDLAMPASSKDTILARLTTFQGRVLSGEDITPEELTDWLTEYTLWRNTQTRRSPTKREPRK